MADPGFIPGVETRVQAHIAALPAQPHGQLDVWLEPVLPLGNLSWEEVREGWGLSAADARFFEQKGLTPEEVGWALQHGTRPRYDCAMQEIHTEPLTVAELRRACKYLKQVYPDISSEDFLRWVSIDVRLVYTPSLALFLGQNLSPERGWLVQAFTPSLFQVSFGSERRLGKSESDRYAATRRLESLGWNLNTQEDYADYVSFALGVAALLPAKTGVLDTAHSYNYFNPLTRLWKEYSLLDPDSPAAETLFRCREYALATGQEGNLLEQRGHGGRSPAAEESLESLQRLCEAVARIKDHHDELYKKDGWPENIKTGKGRLQHCGEFMRRYGTTNLPLFSSDAAQFYQVWQERGEEHMQRWMQYFSARNVNTYDNPRSTLYSWGRALPEEMPLWQKMGFSSYPAKYYHPLPADYTPQQYQAYLKRVGCAPAKGHAVFTLLKSAGGFEALEFWIKNSPRVRAVIAAQDTRGFSRGSSIHTRAKNQLEEWSGWGAEGIEAYRALGEGAFFVNPEDAVLTHRSVTPTGYARLCGRFTTTAIVTATELAYREQRSEGSTRKKEFTNVLLDALSNRKLSSAQELKDLGAFYGKILRHRDGRGDGSYPGSSGRQKMAEWWPTLRRLSPERRQQALQHIDGWIGYGFSVDEALGWWKHWWNPTKGDEASKAKRNHPGYTIEDTIRSANLIRGFAGRS